MQQLKDHYKNILENGHEKPGRNGEFDTPDGSISLFGAQLRFDLSTGELPAATGKKLHLLPMLQEITWMIRGETNTNTLGNNIWDKWALTRDLCTVDSLPESDILRQLHAKNPEKSVKDLSGMLFDLVSKHTNIADDAEMISVDEDKLPVKVKITKENLTPLAMGLPGVEFDNKSFSEELKEMGIETTKTTLQYSQGECGPIYGKQWRAYEGVVIQNGNRTVKVVDQLMVANKLLKTEPYSRRNIIMAWNPALVPDSDVSIETNVALGNMGLPPCHYGMQLEVHGRETKVLSGLLKLRSSDSGVGLPFNIAAYSVVTAIFAAENNMDLGELIVQIGDAHIYNSHVDGINDYLERPLHALPKLTLKDNWLEIRKQIALRGIAKYVDQLEYKNSDEREKAFKKEYDKFYNDDAYDQSPEQYSSTFQLVLNNIEASDILPCIIDYKHESFIKLDLHD